MAKRKTKLLIALFAIIALMVIFAFTLYEWKGIFIIEGILVGIGMAIGAIINGVDKGN
jgi:hypothetical protein